jgi:hypothetical protein
MNREIDLQGIGLQQAEIRGSGESRSKIRRQLRVDFNGRDKRCAGHQLFGQSPTARSDFQHVGLVRTAIEGTANQAGNAVQNRLTREKVLAKLLRQT